MEQEELDKNKDEAFHYHYQAPTALERKKIEDIRREYMPKEYTKTKFDELKILDAKAKRPAIVVAVVLGVVGMFTLGLGMSMVLEWNIFVWGILVSVFGLLSMALAYPGYYLLRKIGKKKYGAKIMSLTEELLHDEENNTI